MTDAEPSTRVLLSSAICHLLFLICHSEYLSLCFLTAVALDVGEPLPVVAADEVIQVTNRSG
jgi:hypothetical protein